MSKFMIENAQIAKASSFQPLVSGNTPEVVNIASTLGKIAQYHDEIETSQTDISNMQDDITDHDTAITELQIDTGKNLIDMSNPSYQKGDIVDNQDGTYTLGGTGSWLRMDFDVDVTPGQLYRFKCDFRNVSGPHAVFTIRDGGLGNKPILPRDPLNNDTVIDNYFTPTENFVRVIFAPVEVSAPGDTGYMTVNPVLYKVSDNEAATRDLVDTGTKNLLPVSSGSAGNAYIFNNLAVNIPKGKYIFVADIADYGTRSELVLNDSSGTRVGGVTFDNAGSVAVPFDVTGGDATTAKLYTMGGTFTNMMICTKSTWDVSHKFIPHCSSMAEMYAAVAWGVDNGAKNIFDIDAEKTAYHATYAISGQNITVTSNGNYARVAIPVHAKAGSYKFSCFVGYSSGSVDIRFAQNADSSGTIADKITVSTTGNVSRDFKLNTDMNFYVVLYTNTTSSSATNAVGFSNIMICSSADYAVSTAFTPYAPTNRELFEEKIDHDIPALTGSILDYAVSLPFGIYFARHGSDSGTDKPETGKRYMYQIMRYTSATMTLIAYEGQGSNSNSIYMKNYTSNSWGPWVKFTGTIVT